MEALLVVLKQIKGSSKAPQKSNFYPLKMVLSAIIDRLEEILVDSVEIIKGVQAKKIKKESRRYKITLANDKK